MESVVSFRQINGGLIPNQKLIDPGHGKTCYMPYANNKDATQPAHPRSLRSTFVVCCLDSIIPVLAVPKI